MCFHLLAYYGRTQQNCEHLQAKKRALSILLDLEIQAPGSIRNTYMLLKPPAYGMLLWQTNLTKTTGHIFY